MCFFFLLPTKENIMVRQEEGTNDKAFFFHCIESGAATNCRCTTFLISCKTEGRKGRRDGTERKNKVSKKQLREKQVSERTYV